MLTRILSAALFAAFLGGLVSAGLMEVKTTPLILEAERYENGLAQSASPGADGIAAAPFGAKLLRVHGTESHDGHEGAVSWAPEDGLERSFYTLITAIGTSFGYALILLAAMLFAGERIGWRSGLGWGIAGFVATALAPSLGLAPELPGSAAAALESRQLWWAGTVLATAAGLWLVLRVSTAIAIAGGLLLLALPHIIGAPHPYEYVASAVPTELSGQFAAASLAIHGITWAVIGAASGFAVAWLARRSGEATPATA